MTFITRTTSRIVGLAGIALLTAGCSGGGEPTAPVSGKVTWNGEAVTSGIVSFSPMAAGGAGGKTASGVVQADGSYTLTTYTRDDGAVLGTHRVLYTASGGALGEGDNAAAGGTDGEHDQETPKSLYLGLIPKVREAEVAAGSNTIDIQLVPMQP
jgi:hypothetical protein